MYFLSAYHVLRNVRERKVIETQLLPSSPYNTVGRICIQSYGNRLYAVTAIIDV